MQLRLASTPRRTQHVPPLASCCHRPLLLRACRPPRTASSPPPPVYSRDLQWLPGGSEMPDETSCRFGASQEGMFEDPPADVEGDILLAKLRPGQVGRAVVAVWLAAASVSRSHWRCLAEQQLLASLRLTPSAAADPLPCACACKRTRQRHVSAVHRAGGSCSVGRWPGACQVVAGGNSLVQVRCCGSGECAPLCSCKMLHALSVRGRPAQALTQKACLVHLHQPLLHSSALNAQAAPGGGAAAAGDWRGR